jgi:hypothetical protein
MRRLNSAANISKAIAGAACAGLLAFSAPAFADGEDDSSADANTSFVDVMNAAHGVIVAVPVNADGDENTDAAVLLAYTGPESLLEEGKIDKALASSVEIGKRAEVLDPESDSNTDSDSSTNRRWNNYWGHGWRNYGYYYGYRPYYNYNNYYWNYGYPYYYGRYYGNWGNYYNGYGYSYYNTYYYPYIY